MAYQLTEDDYVLHKPKRARLAEPEFREDSIMTEEDPTRASLPPFNRDEAIPYASGVIFAARTTLVKIAESVQSLSSASLPTMASCVSQLLQRLQEMSGAVGLATKQLDALLDEVILDCTRILDVKIKLQALRRLDATIDVYTQDIKYLLDGPSAPTFAVQLFIVSQPFAAPVKKQSKIEPIELCLITGPRTSSVNLAGTPITASVVGDVALKGENFEISGNQARLNSENSVLFSDLQCDSCAFLQPISLKFSAEIVIGPSRHYVETTSSQIIVYTNTKQWDAAQGTLLRNSIFTDYQIPAPRFYNYLQFKYLSITNQIGCVPAAGSDDSIPISSSSISRALSLRDFDAFMVPIAKQLKPTEVIHPAEFDKIWEFLGSMFHVIRYTGKIPHLWKEGLFWGLLQRAKASEILLIPTFPIGTFLLRFAEAGDKIGLAYKQSEHMVRHYLLKDNEIKDIIKFIRDNSNVLLRFLRISVSDDGRDTMASMPVEEGFKRIGLKKRRTKKNHAEEKQIEAKYDPVLYDLQFPDSLSRSGSLSGEDFS